MTKLKLVTLSNQLPTEEHFVKVLIQSPIPFDINISIINPI